MIFADGRLTMEGRFHSSFIFPIYLLRKVVGCVQFFPSNLIQNFKEKEDKKVVGCVRKVVFFNFFFFLLIWFKISKKGKRETRGEG